MIPNYDKEFSLILAELQHQEDKHGENNAKLLPYSREMMCYIVEEVGESAQTLNDLHTATQRGEDTVPDLQRFYKAELVQVASLCINEIKRLNDCESNSQTS
jgi:hypothetical protein